MNPALALNAGLLALAVCAASCSKGEERPGAVLCAAALFPIWAVFSLSFDRQFNIPLAISPYADISSGAVWGFMDLLGGVVALLVWRFWWAKALWATFLIETILHAMRWQWGAINRVAYYQALDSIFYAQIALFFVAGGRGLVESVSSFLGARWGVLHFHHQLANAQGLKRV